MKDGSINIRVLNLRKEEEEEEEEGSKGKATKGRNFGRARRDLGGRVRRNGVGPT